MLANTNKSIKRKGGILVIGHGRAYIQIQRVRKLVAVFVGCIAPTLYIKWKEGRSFQS